MGDVKVVFFFFFFYLSVAISWYTCGLISVSCYRDLAVVLTSIKNNRRNRSCPWNEVRTVYIALELQGDVATLHARALPTIPISYLLSLFILLSPAALVNIPDRRLHTGHFRPLSPHPPSLPINLPSPTQLIQGHHKKITRLSVSLIY